MKKYLGIDFGGTFIKGGIVDERGIILKSDSIPTNSKIGVDGVIDRLLSFIDGLLHGYTGVLGIGAGIPGLIDSENGVVVVSGNINWRNVHIADSIKKRYDMPVKIANDANVAALAEARFGSGKKFRSIVFLTLGTGVGGGIVIDGKLFEGNKSAGAELGHMIICKNGRPCTCGGRGCFEAYASATALIEKTKQEMKKDKQSLLWREGFENITGKTAFDYESRDKTAKKIVDWYIKNLSVGVINIANIFRPEAVILGGGIAGQGQELCDRVSKRLDKYIFAGAFGPKVEVRLAELKQAGIVGAASLVMKSE